MGDQREDNANRKPAQPEDERSMKDYCFPQDYDNFGSSLVGLTIGANNFEVKTGRITFIQNTVQFTRFLYEGPNQHLIDILEACDLVKFNGDNSNAIRLCLIKYSLCDKAKAWLQSQEAESITTWNELKKAFLQRYFPMAKPVKIKNNISGFRQMEQEPIYEACEHYEDLLRRCP